MRTTRRGFLASTAAAVALPAAEPLEAGNRKQLFCDRRWIAESRGIALAVNPPRRREPVLLPERPWEAAHMGSYLSVVDDGGGLYRLWYMSFAAKGGGRLCYATSSDGVRWGRPSLDRVEFQGSRDNNIVLASFREGAVFLDPIAPPHQRYKTLASFGGDRPSALGTSNKGTLMVLTSPDGLDWKEEFSVLPFHPDSHNILFWDEGLGKYLAYIRGWNPLRVAVRVEIPRDRLLGPWPYTPSPDPNYLWRRFKWGASWPPTPSTEFPTVLACDDKDPRTSDVYTPNVQRYAWADNVYVAFPSIFRHTKPPGSEQIPMAGILEVQLAVSRDGIRFDRMDRRPYIGLGLPGEADSHSVYMGYGMIRRGSEIYMYYGGGASDHGDGERGGSALFLATQRLDGFVSANAGYEGGEIVTPPLRFEGERLALNIDTSATGTAHVEVLDASGKPHPGFTAADCERIVANDVAREVRFTGGSLRPLSGRPVRLRFQLRNARLYAFQFS